MIDLIMLCYKSILSWYPKEFRAEFGQEMQDIAQQRLQDVGQQNKLQLLQIGSCELVELSIGCLREHLHQHSRNSILIGCVQIGLAFIILQLLSGFLPLSLTIGALLSLIILGIATYFGWRSQNAIDLGKSIVGLMLLCNAWTCLWITIFIMAGSLFAPWGTSPEEARMPIGTWQRSFHDFFVQEIHLAFLASTLVGISMLRFCKATWKSKQPFALVWQWHFATIAYILIIDIVGLSTIIIYERVLSLMSLAPILVSLVLCNIYLTRGIGPKISHHTPKKFQNI